MSSDFSLTDLQHVTHNVIRPISARATIITNKQTKQGKFVERSCQTETSTVTQRWL